MLKKQEIGSEKTTDTNTVKKGTFQAHSPLSQKDEKSETQVKEFENWFFENKFKRQSIKAFRKYSYMYSENYQNIERLLSTFGKSLRGRTIFPEFQIIEEMNKKKIEKKKKEKVNKQEFREQYIPRSFKSRRNKPTRK